MKRVFEIEGFRNMGFKDSKPCGTELILNESGVKGKLGGLLTLVGANNAGKSNVLDAMNIFEKGEFSKKDITDLYMEQACRTPSLTLSVRTLNGKNMYFCTKALGVASKIGYTSENTEDNSSETFSGEENAFKDFPYFLADLETLVHLEEKNSFQKYHSDYRSDIKKSNDLRELQSKILAEILNNVSPSKKETIRQAQFEYKSAFDAANENFERKVQKVTAEIKEGKKQGWYERVEYTSAEQRKLYDECFSYLEEEKQKAFHTVAGVFQEYANISKEQYEQWFNQVIKILLEYKDSQEHFEYDYKTLSHRRSEDWYFRDTDKLELASTNKNAYQQFFNNLTESNKDIYERFFPNTSADTVNGAEFLTLTKLFKEKLNYNFSCKIANYVQKSISVADLNTTSEEISSNNFFVELLHSLDLGVDSIINAYNTFNLHKNKGYLNKLQMELNEKMKVVSAKFNKLFKSNDVPYLFTVELERGGIFFYIYRGDQPLTLDLQSTGFRYFFDLFFNLLNTTELESGDIIIMDEPATNLHVKGQRELRAFLKEFAIQNDILIIIATHSPFMIDTDNLDEIRLVVSDGTVSHIENDFTAYDSGDPDSLRPIKEAFTAENHIIVNPKETVVFVAGMDAYCYLVAFKQLFGITGITFLPVKTFGDDDAEAQTVSNALDKIRSDSFILSESDEAVERMKGIVSDKTVLSLSDIDSRFTTFAALFADGDLPASASVFKNHITRGSVTVGDNTKANFRKVFDKLLHEAE